MKKSIYCPNSDCPNHKKPPEDNSWYRKKGFMTTKREGKKQRLQCKSCKRTFNLNYFTLDYYFHKRIPYPTILNYLVSGSGLRDMERALGYDHRMISRRIQRLSQQIMAVNSRENSDLELTESVAADGLENFILSQFFPTNINVLMGRNFQYLYTFNAYHFKRKGKCTKDQKERKKILYETAQFEERAASNRFREVLDFLNEKAFKSQRKSFTLDTDECPIYDYQFKKHPHIGSKVTHRKTNSKVERNYQNKLFPCNYMDRQIRKDMAEYIRETVQFGRNMNNSMDRFTCYSFWHNFMKPYRIIKKKRRFDTHAEAAGFSRDKVIAIKEEIFNGIRIKENIAKKNMTNFQKLHWDRNLLNPLKCSAV
jgi:transposase-like protein